MIVTKTFSFEAGHRLSDYEGKCFCLHGHEYKVEIAIEGNLDEMGMVIDFGDLKKIFNECIYSKFDHRMILKDKDPYNLAIGKSLPKDDLSICWVSYNPTAENMAQDIFNIFYDKLLEIYKTNMDKKLLYVKVWETPTSCAEANRYE